jgi:hypothetical protein
MTPPSTRNAIDVLIFETNIRFKKDLTRIAPLIDADLRIKRWNIDRDDCSRVLRIESQNLTPTEVIALIRQAGYSCSELQD